MWEELRKFGLQYCDLPTTVWNLACLMRPYSLSIDPRNERSIPVACLVSTLVAITAYIYLYVISAFWFVFIWSPKFGELQCAIVVFSVSIVGAAGITRWIYMLIYQSTVRDIVSGCLASYVLVVPGSRFADNLMKTLRIVKRRAMVFWLVVVGNAIMYILRSLLTPPPFTHLMEDCFIFYGLEPMFESPNFQIAIITDIIAILFTCSLQSNVTAFFIVITGYIEAHMLALNEEMKLIWNDAQSHYREHMQMDMEPEDEITNEDNRFKDEIINEYIRNRLKDIVKSHTTNITLLRKIETLFRDSIATEFMIIISGLIAILLGGLEKTFIQLPYSLMLTGIISLIGQRVTDAGYIFKLGIYNCQWENFDVPNRKTVLMMLTMANKDMILSAGSVTQLNYVCFMTVIKFIYSTYTTLRTTMAKKNST